MNNKDDFKIGYTEKTLENSKEKALNAFLKWAKIYTPVKTGKMKSSWTRIGDNIVNDCEYFDFVNDGTRFIKPRRITERAMRAMEKEMKKENKK